MNILQLLAGAGGGGGSMNPLALMAAVKGRQGPLGGATPPIAPLGGMSAQPLSGGPLAPPLAPPISPLADMSAPQIDSGPAMLPSSAVPTDVPGTNARHGVFGRIGDFLGSDDGKAALFRAGATMLAGGNIGQGALAGAGEVDRRKKLAVDEQHYQSEKGQRDRQLNISQQGTDQNGLYQAGELQNSANRNMLDTMRASEIARHNAAAEGIDFGKLSLDQQKMRVEAELKQMDIAKDIRGQDVSAATTRRGQDITASTTVRGQDNSRHIADENRAYQYGPEVSVKNYDDNNNVTSESQARRPNYGAVRTDGQGNFYTLDTFTGKPRLITPSLTTIRRGPLAQ